MNLRTALLRSIEMEDAAMNLRDLEAFPAKTLLAVVAKRIAEKDEEAIKAARNFLTLQKKGKR